MMRNALSEHVGSVLLAAGPRVKIVWDNETGRLSGC